MIRVVHVGRHELRFAAVDPALVYIRFTGTVGVEEARLMVPMVGQEIVGRDGHVLVDAAGLLALAPDSRRELVAAGQGVVAEAGQASNIINVIFIRASMLHKVVLSQIVSMASLDPTVRIQTHFFDALDDALGWLGLPAALLFAPDPS